MILDFIKYNKYYLKYEHQLSRIISSKMVSVLFVLFILFGSLFMLLEKQIKFGLG
jgi:hypothetical protein